MNIVAAWPRMMTPELAEDYAGGKKLFDSLLEDGLRPRVKGKGFTRYDRCEIDAALDAWKGFGE